MKGTRVMLPQSHAEGLERVLRLVGPIARGEVHNVEPSPDWSFAWETLAAIVIDNREPRPHDCAELEFRSPWATLRVRGNIDDEATITLEEMSGVLAVLAAEILRLLPDIHEAGRGNEEVKP